MLESAGMEPNTPGLDAGDVAGFGAEMIVDPLNLVGGGMLAAILKRAGLLKQALKDANYFNRAAPIRHAGRIASPEHLAMLDALPLLARKHPMLKISQREAMRHAKGKEWIEFVHGPERATPTPMPMNDLMEDAVAPAWEAMSTRYPAAMNTIRDVQPLPERMASSGAGMGTESRTLYANPEKVLSSHGMLHELTHAAQLELQDRFPRLAKKMGVSQDDVTRLESSAYRRESESMAADALYWHLNELRKMRRVAAGMAGYNAAAIPYRASQT